MRSYIANLNSQRSVALSKSLRWYIVAGWVEIGPLANVSAKGVFPNLFLVLLLWGVKA